MLHQLLDELWQSLPAINKFENVRMVFVSIEPGLKTGNNLRIVALHAKREQSDDHKIFYADSRASLMVVLMTVLLDKTTEKKQWTTQSLKIFSTNTIILQATD